MQYLKDAPKTAIIYGDQRIDYHHLIAKVLAFSAYTGGSDGDRVAVVMENRPEWPMAFMSAWQNHQIPVPMDMQSSPEELAFMMRDAGVKTVWCSTKTAANVQAALALVPELGTQMFRIEDIPEPAETNEPLEFRDIPDEEIGVIIYTSGTTGRPKGVILTIKNLRVNQDSVSIDVPIYREDDVHLALLPFHHVLPLQASMLMPLAIHSTIVIVPELKGETIKAAMHDNHVTMLVGVPKLFTVLRDGILKQIHASKLATALFKICRAINCLWLNKKVFKKVQDAFGGKGRYFPCGGAALDEEVIRDMRTVGIEILLGYGLSETAPMVSFPRPGKLRKHASGQLLPGEEAKIVDGEILVRGPNVSPGYWQRPDETAASFDQDGWFHTGDLGYIDEDKYVFITGRKKELIILGNGKNITPEEIEQKIMANSNDLIEECALVGNGDALELLALPKEHTIKTRRILNIEETILDEVIEPYNEHAASYKRILKLALLSEPLPRTRLGKLKRHELSKILKGNGHKPREDAAPAPNTQEYALIHQYLEDTTGQQVQPDDHFELDLGVDSLGKVAFITYLNGTFGNKLSEETLVDFPTARTLAAHLAGLAVPGAELQGKTFNWHDILNEPVDVTLPQPGWSHLHLHGLSRFFLGSFLCKVEGTGLENLPDTPFILAPNHQSFLDSFFLTAVLAPKTIRDAYSYATAKHINGVLARHFARTHNVIVMDLNGDIRRSLQTLAVALRQGKIVSIFPEGTRSMDGSLSPFKPAFAILAKELNVPVVPVAIQGAYEMFPRGKRWPRYGQNVRVNFLPRILPQPTDTYQAISDRTAKAIQEAMNR
ncbi:MAG: AMP-binding protein [Victivallales bacterium]|nr:AMP-binding protein [Victivallales bacterium]